MRHRRNDSAVVTQSGAGRVTPHSKPHLSPAPKFPEDFRLAWLLLCVCGGGTTVPPGPGSFQQPCGKRCKHMSWHQKKKILWSFYQFLLFSGQNAKSQTNVQSSSVSKPSLKLPSYTSASPLRVCFPRTHSFLPLPSWSLILLACRPFASSCHSVSDAVKEENRRNKDT